MCSWVKKIQVGHLTVVKCRGRKKYNMYLPLFLIFKILHVYCSWRLHMESFLHDDCHTVDAIPGGDYDSCASSLTLVKIDCIMGACSVLPCFSSAFLRAHKNSSPVSIPCLTSLPDNPMWLMLPTWGRLLRQTTHLSIFFIFPNTALDVSDGQ